MPSLFFAPYPLLPTQEFESILEKTPLGPERRLMLAVLEETVAYVLEVVSRNGGLEPVRVHYPIFLPLADLLWACVPTMSQTRTQSFNLILNRRDRFQVVCDSKSVFPFHVFETMRRSLDDFSHEALDIIQVGLSPR